MITKVQTSIEDLYRTEESAEIVNGEIIKMSPTGAMPSFAASEIFVSLRGYSRRTKSGWAVGDNTGFRVKLADRESFSPDASYYVGQHPGMKFYEGAPIFAVEVRSENDYGDDAEEKIRKKKQDYFLAGTKVFWDVDLIGIDTIKVYRDSDPDNPTIYRRGEIAEAEPVLPSWIFPVNDLFFA